MKNISYCLLAGLIFGSCSGKVYEQTDNGVIVKVQQKGGQDTRLVRFQVMGDKLIHVSATPESKFTDSKSLVVVPQEKQTPFTVSQQGDTITVSTKEVKAFVLSSTGEVWFTDENGKMILQENKGGGKTFTPIEVEGTKDIQSVRYSNLPMMKLFMGWASIRQRNSTIKERTKSCSSIIQRYLFHSLYRTRIMVFCWTVILFVVLVTPMTILS